MRSTIRCRVLLMAVVVSACGGSLPAAETTLTPAAERPEGPVATTQAEVRPTLGMSAQQFVDTWNRVISEGMPALVLTELTDSREPGVLENEFSEILVLRVTIDEDSGELTRAMVSSSVDFDDEYDGWMLLGAASALVAASNHDLDEPALIDEAFEKIGIPGGGNSPEGVGDGDYESSGVIQGVLYTFTETPDEYVLAAQPSG